MSLDFDTPLYQFDVETVAPTIVDNTKVVINDLDAKLVDTNVCAYCQRKKKSELLIAAPYIGSMFGIVRDNPDRLKFCDYICAKLYNDNRERITVDTQYYKQLYTKNKLDKKSRIIYERVGTNFFAFLPTYIVDDDNYIEHRHTLERLI
jgi:hypothetical protein